MRGTSRWTRRSTASPQPLQRIVSQGGDLTGDRRFELSAERKNGVFIARPSNQLDTDGQPAGAHRQRQADRRLSGAVEWVRETQPVKEFCRGGLDVLAESPDFRRRIGQRRREQYIDLVPGRDQFPGLLVQPRERLQVFDGRRR